MKIIPGQKITAVTASSADANFPDDNVIDEHPKKIWKAAIGVSSATLTVEISGGSSGLAIFNTNALTITAVVDDANAVEWFTADADWFATDAEWSSEDAVLEDSSELDGISGAAWFEWPYSTNSKSGVFTLTCSSSDEVYAGIIIADKVYEYASPRMGISEGIHSYSIVKELQNGAFYRKERDKVRTFSFSFIEGRDNDFYEFMYTVARELGYKPAAWQLTTQNGFWWVVFARFDRGMPSGIHSVPDYSRISTQLIEVL